MPKSRKRKVPIVQVDHGTTTASRPQATRTVIREFHVLLKRQAHLHKQATQDAQVTSELSQIQQRIDELGGLQRYQHMSAVGQKEDRGGGSHRVLISWLKDLGVHKEYDNGKKLRCACERLQRRFSLNSVLACSRLVRLNQTTTRVARRG